MGATLERRAGPDCHQCGAPMDVLRVRKYEGQWPYWCIGGGILMSFFGGFFIGVLVLLWGVYAASAKQAITCCPKCGYYFKTYRPHADHEA